MRRIVLKYFILLAFMVLISAFAIKAAIFTNTGIFTEDYLVKDKNKAVRAVIYFGTPVNKGKITGWVDRKSMTMYSAPDGQLEYATVIDPKIVRYVGDVKSGYYRSVIYVRDSELELAQSLEDVTKKYEKKYYDNCATCHTAYDIKRYSIRQWKGILISMKPHTSLSDNEMNSLFRYIKLVIVSD